MTKRTATFSSCFVLLALSSGCVPADAGQADVRRLIDDQLGLRLPERADAELSAAERERVRVLTSAPLSANGAAELALLHNPEVAAALQEVGVARGQLVSASAIPNPVAEASVHFGHDSPSLELGVMEDLSEILLRSSRKAAADEGLRAAARNAALRIVNLVFEARASTIDLQAARELAELEGLQESLAHARYDAARRLRDAGNITELAVARHQAAYEDQRLMAADAHAAALQAERRLASTLGLPSDAAALRVTTVGKALPRAPLERTGALQRILERNLELSSLQARVASASERESFARTRGILPELRAGAVAEREDREWSLGPAVELELPIFYQGQGEISAARAERGSHLARARALIARLGNLTQAAFERMDAARERVRLLDEQVLPVKQRIVREAQLQYNAMSIGVFELLAAKADELTTARMRIVAVREYRLARNAVSQLLAGGMPQAATVSTPSAAPPAPGAGHRGH